MTVTNWNNMHDEIKGTLTNTI